VGDCWLQGIEAAVEWQQRVLAKGNDDGLILDRQDSRFGFPQIGDRPASPPFGDSLLVDAVPPGQDPQALLTMLYRSTDCLRRCGAAMKNLADSASFHAGEKTAP
jgi:hypothetical protein